MGLGLSKKLANTQSANVGSFYNGISNAIIGNPKYLCEAALEGKNISIKKPFLSKFSYRRLQLSFHKIHVGVLVIYGWVR